MEQNKVFQEVDVMEVLKEVGSKNKVLQAKLLQEMEKRIKDNDEFMKVRSVVLDEVNSYTRSIIRLIFGDIEFMNYQKR
jgi:hypothetical protein